MSLQPTKEMIEMQKLYRFTELEFLDFNRMIPHDHNPDTVFSPELFNLLYSIGPQIYGMFEILTTSFLLRPSKKDFPSYHKVLNAKKLLSSQRVILRDNQRELRPFVTKSEVKEHPWWAVYNGSKHAMPYGIFDVKLKIILNALGGLYILHHILDAWLNAEGRGFNIYPIIEAKNWKEMTTIGQYVHRVTPQSRSSTLYEYFESQMFVPKKRFWPVK